MTENKQFSADIRTARPLWRLAAAGLLVYLPGACLPTGEMPALDGLSEVAAPIEPGGSATGNYIAGRHAQARHDMKRAAYHLTQALADDPRDVDLLRRTFRSTIAGGRMDEAVALARRLVALDPKSPLANHVLVADDIRAGRYAEAESRLGEQPDTGIDIFMAPLMRAWALAGQGQADAAFEALKAFDANEGFIPLRTLHTALINDIAGRMDAAGKAFDETAAGQKEPTLRFVLLAGNHYERAGRSQSARKLYDRYMTHNPGSRLLDGAYARLAKGEKPVADITMPAHGVAEALFGITSSFRQQRVSRTALIFGRLALHLKPDFPIIQILLAGILEADGRLEKANGFYGAVSPSSPFSRSARIRMAANLDRLDHTDDAIAQLRALAAEDKGLSGPLVDVGDILRSRERFDEAVLAYDEAIARLPKLEKQHWGLFYARGIALERSNQWPRAEKDFLKALKFSPDQPYVLNYLGYSWVEKGKNLDEAQNMIKKAVSIRPTDGYIIDSLGWVYFRLGNYDASVKELERAIELKPDDPVINDHLGDAYWQVGRYREARFQWRRTLGLDPEPKVKEAVEKKLKSGLAVVKPVGENG